MLCWAGRPSSEQPGERPTNQATRHIDPQIEQHAGEIKEAGASRLEQFLP